MVLALIAAILGEQWARARTASSLIELADEFRNSGSPHRDTWDNLEGLLPTLGPLNSVNAGRWSSAFQRIGNAALPELTDLVELRLEVESVFVLPWHRSAKQAKALLTDGIALAENALGTEIRQFYLPGETAETISISVGPVIDDWQTATPELCAVMRRLETQLHAAIPSAPWVWDGLHDDIPDLTGERPYTGMPDHCP
ncbi:MAG: hypothetical protein ABIJ48_06275 [Actinomycetota bacterium]